MPQERELASHIYIKVGGADLQRAVEREIQEVVVDQHAHLPGMFTIRVLDPELKHVNGDPFDLTKEIEIQAAKQGGERVPLIKGEITALEPIFGVGMVLELAVRGYDKSHRMYRETKSKAHLNKKDSDLASEIAQAYGLQAEVDATSTVYDHIYQHNQSDLGFLIQRAWRIGYECFVTDGKLHFGKPPTGSSQVTLTWGDDLQSFRPRMTLAEQVKEVLVRGWDASTKTAIVGRAGSGQLYARVGDSKDGAAWADSFGTGKLVIVDQPVMSQAEADTLAAARLDEISGAFIEAEGEAFRRPDVQAGRTVSITGLGRRLSGTYLVTRAVHVYTAEGLKTCFTVRGTRTGIIGDEIGRRAPLERWPGVVPAIVTNTDDPQGWGCVKVKFPWMTDDAESAWARVISAGAGNEAGLFASPAVGDEVAVAFVHGDFSHPVVLGGLWNGKDKVPPEAAAAATGEKPLIRVWRSRKGHRLAIHDNADNKLELVTEGGHRLTLDDAQGKITLKSKGGLTVTLDDNASKITVESSNEVEVKATGNLTMQSNAKLSLKGTQVAIEGTAQASLKAATVSIEGQALAEVKGGLVKLN
jgi:phage protein D